MKDGRGGIKKKGGGKKNGAGIEKKYPPGEEKIGGGGKNIWGYQIKTTSVDNLKNSLTT